MNPSILKILVIEDSDPDFRLMAEYLKESAFPLSRIVRGKSLAEALKIMEEEGLGAIVSDLGLPDSQGLATLKAIVKKNPQVPVIVVTGFDDERSGVEALQKGAQDFLVKGRFGSDALNRSIRYAIERKEIDKEHEETIEFLKLVNESKGSQELVRAATAFFRKRAGCEAVGVRLKEKNDYPYFEAQGFPEEFVLAENSLCSRNSAGEVVCDLGGNPVLSCLCGNVISGHFDPSKAFFTDRGSFWTNGTTELLANTSEADRQARTRNRCNGEGYESVALLPLRAGADRIGLLQLNDRRKGLFSSKTIAQWERLADYLAVALVKFRAEETLAQERGNLQKIFDVVNVGMLLIDEDGRVQRANDVVYRWIGEDGGATGGLQPGNMLKCIYALSDPAGCGQTPHCRTCSIRKSFETVLSSGQSIRNVETEATILTGGGPVRLCFSINADPISIEEKRNVVLTLNDITAHKRVEKHLQWNQHRNLLLSECATMLLASEDPQTVVERVSRKIMEFLDCQVFFNFIMVPGKNKFRLNACAGISSQEAGRIEWLDCCAEACGCVLRDRSRILTEDILTREGQCTDMVRGSEVRAYCCHPLLVGNELVGTLSFGTRDRDKFTAEELLVMSITADLVAIAMQRKNAEEVLKRDKETFERMVGERTKQLVEAHAQLAQAKRLSDVGALAATVAHELRTPLSVIRIGAYNMRRKNADESLLKHITHIEKKVAESEKIINNLLFYSRIKMPSLEEVNLYSLLEECVDHARENLKGHAIRILTQFDPIEKESFRLDPLQIKEVFHNILANAADALEGHEKGRIKVAARRHDAEREIAIIFEDNGSGIHEEDLKKIHEPFFTTKTKGTGLGLTVSFQIIQNHNGRIEVTSEKGKGTVFTVYLPFSLPGRNV